MPFTEEGARKEAGRQALMNNSMRQRTKEEEEERARRRMGATSAETCMYGTCEQSGKETRRPPGYLPFGGHGAVFFIGMADMPIFPS